MSLQILPPERLLEMRTRGTLQYRPCKLCRKDLYILKDPTGSVQALDVHSRVYRITTDADGSPVCIPTQAFIPHNCLEVSRG